MKCIRTPGAVWLDDEVVHVLCANPDTPTPAPREVCTECWVTKPCWCEAAPYVASNARPACHDHAKEDS
jgi:hypothetical protein